MKAKHVFLILAIMLVVVNISNAQSASSVLAEVNGSKLTYGYLIDQFPEEYRSQINREQVTRLVENWIETELLYQEGLKHNVQKDQRIINMIEQQRKEIIAARYADLSLDMNFDLTDVQVDSLYNANKDKYVTQDNMYRLSHIVLSSKGGAEAVYSRLLNGDDFNALVHDYSEDEQSRKDDGNVGILVESGLEPNVVEVLRNTEKGSYTKPVKSQSGYYHIFWVKDKMPKGTLLKLEDIRVEIEESYKAEKQQVIFEQMLDKLKGAASIKRNSLNAIFNE